MEWSSCTVFGDFPRRRDPPTPHARPCSACAAAALRPQNHHKHRNVSRAATRRRPRVPLGPLPPPPVRSGQRRRPAPRPTRPPSPVSSCRQIHLPAARKTPCLGPVRRVNGARIGPRRWFRSTTTPGDSVEQAGSTSPKFLVYYRFQLEAAVVFYCSK